MTDNLKDETMFLKSLRDWHLNLEALRFTLKSFFQQQQNIPPKKAFWEKQNRVRDKVQNIFGRNAGKLLFQLY